MTALLGTNWLTEQPIDFEFKQYMLLAYKQNQHKKLSENLLYPSLKDIVDHKVYVDKFMLNIQEMEDSKVEAKGIDWINKRIVYKSLVNDNSMDEIKRIGEFSKEILDGLFFEFQMLYDEVDDNINIEGQIMSMFTFNNGYVVFEANNKIYYYEYSIKKEFFPEPTWILDLQSISQATYFRNRYMKNYFVAKSSFDYPYEETVKPVFKRKFLETVVRR